MGLDYQVIRRGSFRKEDAQNFARALPRSARELLVVSEKAPCHVGMEEVLKNELNGNKFRRLVLYSPMLNPIEGALSVLKPYEKIDNSNSFHSGLAGVGRGNWTQTKYRQREL